GGYRYQMPDHLVIGLDVSAPVWVSTRSANIPSSTIIGSVHPLFVIAPEIQIGYAIGRWLPYAGFGVGVADVKATDNAGCAILTTTVADPLLIVTFGVNYAVTNNWILGLRYDHIHAEERNYVFNTTGGPTVIQAGMNSDGIAGVVQYKFP